jgi:hypothetical protein
MKEYFSKFKELQGSVSQELNVASKRIVISFDEFLFHELPTENRVEYQALAEKIGLKEREAADVYTELPVGVPHNAYGMVRQEARALLEQQEMLLSRVVRPTYIGISVYAAGDYILRQNGAVRDYDSTNKSEIKNCMKILSNKALREMESLDNRDIAEILLYADAESGGFPIRMARQISKVRGLVPEKVRVFTPNRKFKMDDAFEVVNGDRSDLCAHLTECIPNVVRVEMTEDLDDRALALHTAAYNSWRQSK